jgi:hypothetical protein
MSELLASRVSRALEDQILGSPLFVPAGKAVVSRFGSAPGRFARS